MSSETKWTPGPWRWEINMKSKVLHLVGGRPAYDLTIMDFVRWGMSDAVARLRDPTVDGMNIMHRLCDRKDWIAPFTGRSHHANWCANVTHPDMQLIAASPKLYEALAVSTHLVESYMRLHGEPAENIAKTTAPARTALASARGEG